MNKEQFFEELKQNLMHLSKEEREEILEDFEEHFHQGHQEGKEDMELIDQLGDPKEIGQSYSKGKIQQYVPRSSDADWQRILDAESIRHIEVNADLSHVEMLQGDVDKIEVSVYCREQDWIKDFETLQTGDRLIINLEKKKSWKFKFRFGTTLGNIKTRVVLPRKKFDSISVETDTGNIVSSGLEAEKFFVESDTGFVDLKEIVAGKLDVTTDVGKIKLSRITAQRTKVETDTGVISVTDSISGEWDLESDVGPIKLERVLGKISAETDVGNITILTESISAPMNLETDVGQVELGFQQGDASISISTDVGKVNNQHPHLKEVEVSRSFVGSSGTYRIGAGTHKVSISTDVGRILLHS